MVGWLAGRQAGSQIGSNEVGVPCISGGQRAPEAGRNDLAHSPCNSHGLRPRAVTNKQVLGAAMRASQEARPVPPARASHAKFQDFPQEQHSRRTSASPHVAWSRGFPADAPTASLLGRVTGGTDHSSLPARPRITLLRTRRSCPSLSTPMA